MCQIFAGPSNAVRTLLLDTPLLLDSVYAGNPDGLGWMFAHNGQVITGKYLPRSTEEARALIARLPEDDRQVALHFRMRTHGDVDLENVHPYKVTDDVYLIHNGVLSHGNAADRSKSDTWHYARSMESQLKLAPALASNAAWLSLVQGDIGRNNRFVVLSSNGHMTILNRSTGYTYGQVWVANTYSFDAGILWPQMNTYRGVYVPDNPWGKGDPRQDDDAWCISNEEIKDTLDTKDMDQIEELVTMFMEDFICYLWDEQRYVPPSNTAGFTSEQVEAMNALAAIDEPSLYEIRPKTLAYVLTFAGRWEPAYPED